MAEHGENLIVRRNDDITVVAFARGDIIDAAYIQDIEDEMARLVASVDPPSVVIDFERVRFLTSSALGILVGLRGQLHRRGGRLCIANVVDELLEVFLLTRLTKILDMYGTTEKAVASFSEKP